jgi:hypothetical protein
MRSGHKSSGRFEKGFEADTELLFVLKAAFPLSPESARLYPLTFVPSNAPRARSDVFCAAESPLMPVILSRS